MPRLGFEPVQWWETASSQWQCLRPHGHQGRPSERCISNMLSTHGKRNKGKGLIWLHNSGLHVMKIKSNLGLIWLNNSGLHVMKNKSNLWQIRLNNSCLHGIKIKSNLWLIWFNNSGLHGMKNKTNLGLIWLDKSDLHDIKKAVYGKWDPIIVVYMVWKSKAI